jgi:hypothetical protein
MVAIRFPSSEAQAKGFLLLAQRGPVRTLRGPVYVCRESALGVLDADNILYEKLPLPLNLNEVDALQDTPTTRL